MKSSDTITFFQEQLETLKIKYLQSFPEKIKELKNSWHGLDSGQADQVPALAHYAHKLAGSAGSYGYPEISHHAVTLWNLLENAVSCGDITLEKSRTQINLQVERLCKALTDQQDAVVASTITVEKN